MKLILVSIVIIIMLAASQATDDVDKEEIKRLKALAKILIDKAAVNKLNELVNSGYDGAAPNRENLLLKALTSHAQFKSKQHEKRKIINDEIGQRVIACESEELENLNLAC